MKTEKCEACNGLGQCVVSCCDGSVIEGDFHICHICHEHLGEDTCPYCEGSGYISIEDNNKQFVATVDISLLVDEMMNLED